MQEQHISELKNTKRGYSNKKLKLNHTLEELDFKIISRLSIGLLTRYCSGIYHARSGFGSLDEAKKKDPSMKMQDVKQFFAKHEEKRKRRRQNSFFAPHSFYELELDYFHIKKRFRKQTRILDWSRLEWIYSKYATVIPTKSKHAPDALAG